MRPQDLVALGALLLLSACTAATEQLDPGGLQDGAVRDQGTADAPGDPESDGGTEDGGARDGSGDSGMVECASGPEIPCTCADGRAGLQSCRVDGTLGACRCGGTMPTDAERLEQIRLGMVGRWTGTVTTPWRPPYTVDVTFRLDGGYSARCREIDCVAFYYGSDDDSPSKTWEVFDVRASGAGQGRIVIVFSQSSTNYDELDHIFLTDHDNELDFEFWHAAHQYGPVVFDLHRSRTAQ